MRKLVLALGALVALACGSARAQSDGYAFTILRGDSPIGTHRVSISRGGDQTAVDLATEIAVKIAFVTVYRYTQTVRQVWKAGRLQSFDCETDDNGDKRTVQARSTPAGLEVTAPHGRYVAPADTVPTGYWNADILRRREALDSNGKLVPFAFEPAGTRTVQVDGRPVEVRLHKISGGADGEVGYAPDGTWVSLALNERGNDISYRRLPQARR